MDGFQPIYIPGPMDAPGNTGGLSGGSILQGAGGSLAAGIGAALTPVLGPLGPIAGSFLGGLFGKATPGGGAKGLGDALSTGIGSLFGSSKASNVSNQTQNVGQSTDVNVENVLGGRKFGNFDETTGQFDEYQAIADVYAIKAAQDQARLASSASQPASAAVTKTPLNFLPLIVVGGAAAAFFLLRGRK